MFKVHFLDVGRGDTTVLQFRNGRIYLIDHYLETGKTDPLDYLVGTLGATELETLVVTHPHRDHFLGVQRIIEAIPVRQVWLSDYPRVGPSYRSFEQILETREEIRVLFPRSGSSIAEGKDRIHILAPTVNLLRGTREDVNNASLVLKVIITHPDSDSSTSVILGADAGIASWQQIIMEHGRNLQADLLKVSHHGSQHGTDPEAITAISPQYSIISVGNNPHGHPEPQTLQLISAHTANQVFRTDIDGTCVFESDGLRWNPVFP